MEIVHIYWSDIKRYSYTPDQIQLCMHLSGLCRREYLNPKDEERHVTGILLAEWGRRYCSSRYSNQKANCWIGFTQRPGERPSFAAESPLEFSVSHSEDIVVCAISNRSVGIDVEYSNNEIQDMMRQIARPEELGWINEHAKSDVELYQLWTHKESYLKCIGSTISGIRKIFPMINNSTLIERHNEFRFRPISIRSEYAVTLCTTFDIDFLSVEEIEQPCLIKLLDKTQSPC